MSQSITPLLYDEALDDWFAAACQMRRNERDPICGRAAVVHRPNRAVVRHVCVDHATPPELAERVAREPLCPPYDAAPRQALPTERS